MRALIALGLTALVATSARGQVCNQALVGRLTGQDGKPVMAGNVAITGQMKAAFTDSTGRYRLCDVPPGKHSMTATAWAMQPVVIDHVMSSDRTDTLDFHMKRPPGCWLPPTMNAAQLDSAYRRWTAAKLHSYDLTITLSDGPGPGSWRVHVRADSVTAAEMVPPGRTSRAANLRYLSILLPAQLFARLRMRLTDSNRTTSATYDRTLGYPARISDEENCITDAGGTIRLEALIPIRP